MYINYGDRNFFEYGCLVDAERAIPESVAVIYCRPFDDPDENGDIVYCFAECNVDTTDSWIDRKAVCSYADVPDPAVSGDTEDLIRFAIACIEYYGVENFSSPYNGYVHDRTYIKDVLKWQSIDHGSVDID